MATLAAMPKSDADQLRERLTKVRELREDANERKREAVASTVEVLQEVRASKAISITETAQLLGMTRDSIYKALAKAER